MNKILEDLKEFLKMFNCPLPFNEEELVCKGKQVFLPSEKLQKTMENIPIDAFSPGLCLGESAPRKFSPSFALLDMLKESSNKIIIKQDAEWLFTCKRDIFVDNILKKDKPRKIFLVLSERKEVLGLGMMDSQGSQKFIKPIFDRGDFLRREEKKRR